MGISSTSNVVTKVNGARLSEDCAWRSYKGPLIVSILLRRYASKVFVWSECTTLKVVISKRVTNSPKVKDWDYQEGKCLLTSSQNIGVSHEPAIDSHKSPVRKLLVPRAWVLVLAAAECRNLAAHASCSKVQSFLACLLLYYNPPRGTVGREPSANNTNTKLRRILKGSKQSQSNLISKLMGFFQENVLLKEIYHSRLFADCPLSDLVIWRRWHGWVQFSSSRVRHFRPCPCCIPVWDDRPSKVAYLQHLPVLYTGNRKSGTFCELYFKYWSRVESRIWHIWHTIAWHIIIVYIE